jgi:hypothetical protein
VIGVSVTQYGAAALIIVATALALIPRDVRTIRADYLTAGAEPAGARQAAGQQVSAGWPEELPERADDLVGGGARR